MDPYLEHLSSKLTAAEPAGFDVDESDLHMLLFDWQKLAVKWGLHQGRAAYFHERGLGKTLQQVIWADHIYRHTGRRILIACPLAVARQTIREGRKVDVDIEYVRSMDDVKRASTPIVIVNYDMLKHLDPGSFGGFVGDEASILKSYTGQTKRFIIEKFLPGIYYLLFCTATPDPNDTMELGNYAEGLRVMPSSQMLANWFLSSQGDVKTGEIVAGKYKLRPYAEEDFWRWVTTWACVVSRPSDLGFSDEGYIRQPLDIRYHLVDIDHRRAWEKMDQKGQRQLLLDNAVSATEMWSEKAKTFRTRCWKALDIITAEPDEYHIVWCDTNEESGLMYQELAALYSDVVEVRGSDKLSEKEAKLDAFSTGQARIIVTKSKIAGLGLNWQHCARQTFVSVNFKWEEWYQAIGRTDRFGNPRQTIVNMIYTENEQRIIKTLERKGRQHARMHEKVRQIIAKYGIWRTDRKELAWNLGSMEMRIPAWLSR